MTREEAGQFWPIIKAYAEGEKIEVIDPYEGEWEIIEDPNFTDGVNSYRVKKKPVYRPFGSANECWEEMAKHQPIGWIKSSKGVLSNIFEIGQSYIMIARDGVRAYTAAINDFVFADGTPFGIKEEEQS